MSCSSPAAIPGDRVRARGPQAQAQLRARAHGGGARAEPRADRAASRSSRRALAGAAVRAPAGDQAQSGRRGAAANRPARRLRARGDRAGARAVALPQQARVLLRRSNEDGELQCGFHAPAGGTAGRADRGLPARLRARQPRARAGAGLVSRAGLERLGAQRGSATTATSGAASPDRTGAHDCATWSCARAGAPASCRSAS